MPRAKPRVLKGVSLTPELTAKSGYVYRTLVSEVELDVKDRYCRTQKQPASRVWRSRGTRCPKNLA